MKATKQEKADNAVNPRMRIGIINDSQILTVTLKNFISDLGYDACSKVLSESGCSEHNIDHLDVLIVPEHVDRPYLHGIIRKNPAIMVVFIKNNGQAMSAKEALANRVYAFLSTPVHFNELEVVLTRLQQYHLNNSKLNC